MRILVDEEYGFRNWIWIPDVENEDQLVEWWRSTMTAEYVDEFVFYDITEMEGEWEELDAFDCRMDESYDGFAAIHTSENTHLRLGEDTYPVDGD
jgi:hypothetical protein